MGMVALRVPQRAAPPPETEPVLTVRQIRHRAAVAAARHIAYGFPAQRPTPVAPVHVVPLQDAGEVDQALGAPAVDVPIVAVSDLVEIPVLQSFVRKLACTKCNRDQLVTDAIFLRCSPPGSDKFFCSTVKKSCRA